jgi:hypothetical protein
MLKMNRARTSLKHHGQHPTTADLARYRADVSTFLTDATTQIFGLDFESINMIDIVAEGVGKDHLRSAQASADGGDLTAACGFPYQAFEWLIRDYATRKRDNYGQSPFLVGGDIRRLHSEVSGMRRSELPRHGLGSARDAELRPVVEKVKAIQAFVDSQDAKVRKALDLISDALRPIQETLGVLTLGIDYRQYAKFSMTVPQVIGFMDGHVDVTPRPGVPLTPAEYEWCRSFVISVALHLAAMDFDMDLVALARQAQASQQP